MSLWLGSPVSHGSGLMALPCPCAPGCTLRPPVLGLEGQGRDQPASTSAPDASCAQRPQTPASRLCVPGPSLAPDPPPPALGTGPPPSVWLLAGLACSGQDAPSSRGKTVTPAQPSLPPSPSSLPGFLSFLHPFHSRLENTFTATWRAKRSETPCQASSASARGFGGCGRVHGTDRPARLGTAAPLKHFVQAHMRPVAA